MQSNAMCLNLNNLFFDEKLVTFISSLSFSLVFYLPKQFYVTSIKYFVVHLTTTFYTSV